MIIKKVGFIGLGAMGFPMAKHLLNKGFEVHISKHSNKKESLDRINYLKCLGAKIKDGISNVPLGVDLIITILPTDLEVKSVLINEKFYNNVEKDAIILEMTSCSPDTVIEVEKYYSQKNVKIIDAPVSGGVIGAENGTLTIFGSGDKEVLNGLNDVLKAFATNIHYIGKLGTGKALKSINQMMVAINTMGLIEGYAVAKEQGIDWEIMYNVIKESSGNSYSLNRYIDRLKDENFEGGFKLSLMRKDLKTALESSNNIPLPFTNLLYNFFLMANEYDDKDYSVISKLINKEN